MPQFTEQQTESIFELAFGDNATNRGFEAQEVVEELEKQVQEFPKFKEYIDRLQEDPENQTRTEDSEFFERLQALIQAFDDGIADDESDSID